MRQVDIDYRTFAQNNDDTYTSDAFYAAWNIQNKRLIDHQDKIDALVMTIQDNNPTESQLRTLKELFPNKFYPLTLALSVVRCI